jgi:phosphatidylserine decarboxylase
MMMMMNRHGYLCSSSPPLLRLDANNGRCSLGNETLSGEMMMVMMGSSSSSDRRIACKIREGEIVLKMSSSSSSSSS